MYLEPETCARLSTASLFTHCEIGRFTQERSNLSQILRGPDKGDV